MAINRAFGLLFFSTFVSAVVPQANFELYNKHLQPIYYSLSDSVQAASHNTDFNLIKPGAWVAKVITTKQPLVVAFTFDKKPVPSQPLDLYIMPANTTWYLRIGLPEEKEKFIKRGLKKILGRDHFEGKNYIFGPQTGPLLGLKRNGELHIDHNTGQRFSYSLKNNVRMRDIKKVTVVYQPE